MERFTWSTGSSRLGVMVSGLTPELRTHYGAPADRGLLVARVEAGSPAATAGIAVGDVLLEVGGAPVESAGDVIEALSSASGKPIGVTLVRDRKRLTFDVTPTRTTMPLPKPLHELMRKLFPKFPTTTT